MPIIKPMITQIDRAETVRYAGLSRAKDWEPELIDGACAELLAVAQPLVYYRLVDYQEALIDNTYTHNSSVLAKHLSGCTRVLLVAATLGAAVDDKIDAMFQEGRYVAGVLISAAATALIEQATDYAQAIVLKTVLAGKGQRLGQRFSPGYADWNLEEQRGFFPLLQAQEIGMSLSSACSLLPKKSITAIVPVLSIEKPNSTWERGCQSCGKQDCSYQMRAKGCKDEH